MGVESISMPESQTNSGADLHLELSGARLRSGLTDALRDAVRSGRLPPGTRLPASRTLAVDLGVSRSTVTECYAELVAEGWLAARQGSGTRVAGRASPRRAFAPAPPGRLRPMEALMPGAADFAEFPRTAWLASARRALSAAPPSAFGYGDVLGRMELRTALADYLSRVRGVSADPSRIVICSGFHHGLTLIAHALKARGARAVAVEEYGLDLYRALLTDAGLAIPPLRVDADGARVGELTDVAAVLLTPAHQFPTGVALSAERRAAVLDWARGTGALILEDDYDGEFRYDRKPVGALQGLDPDHVVYFGTASKSLAPALRVAWMVTPGHLIPDVTAAKGRVETVSVLDQLTLADFITAGAFDRHIRARRQTYRRRREQMVAALAHAAPDVRVLGMAAGLQAVLQLPPGTEITALRAAARHGLTVSRLADFHHDSRPDRDALVINYSAVSDSAWDGTLAALVAALSP
jgi:GntR family transcriptional regulator / MocR family aminotransferase